MRYASALLLLLLSGPILHPSFLLAQESDKDLQRLANERNKFSRQTNLVDRAKTGIKISELLITFVRDAAQQGEFELMQSRLTEYTEVIQSAHESLVQTGRDAHSKPSGFKDLEIAIRRQLRQLEDIGGALTYDQRDPVLKAQSDVAGVREAILKAMFGGQNAAVNRP